MSWPKPSKRVNYFAPVAAIIAHGMRMSVNLVIVKMIAVFVGPAGLGTLGHFMSLSTMISVFAGGGIGNGITKYVAEYRLRPRLLLRFIGSAIVYGCVFSFLILVISVIAAKPLSALLFGDYSYVWLIYCVGFSHFLCFIGTAVIAIVNGLQLPVYFAGVTLAGYLGALPVAYFLISSYGMKGAALSILVALSCTGFPAIFLVLRSRLTRITPLTIDLRNIKRLGRFSMMLMASASLFPLTEILIRSRIIGLMGNEEAGLWQAMTRLSTAYLGFFTVFLTTSYMPKLSSSLDKNVVAKLVRRCLFNVSIVFSVFAFILYFNRHVVIKLLFSPEFFGMSELFGYQLLGDLFRICSYVIGFLAVAKAATSIYILAEFIQTGLYLACSLTAIICGGSLVEVAQAYALTYFVYFVIAGFVFYIYNERKF